MWLSKPGRDRDGRIHVADERLRPVGEALVDPIDLVRVLVALEQVLVLVGEHALVEARPGRCARARVGRRVVGRVRTGAMQPVEASIVITLRSKKPLTCDEKNPAM